MTKRKEARWLSNKQDCVLLHWIHLLTALFYLLQSHRGLNRIAALHVILKLSVRCTLYAPVGQNQRVTYLKEIHLSLHKY